MNILVACEECQRVCQAFRDKGHNAFSCDIIEPSGNKPEWHIKADVLPLINGKCVFTTMDGKQHEIKEKWDMIIAFPPCIYLTTAGACRLYPQKGVLNQERYEQGKQAAEFFMSFYNADCEKIVIENPTPLKIYNLPKYNQVIEPYMFGEPYKKRTCLWIKGVEQLKPTNIIKDGITSWVNAGTKNSKGEKRQNIGIKSSSKDRSKTFKGIAAAMAAQWG